jgi:hypothetical protein
LSSAKKLFAKLQIKRVDSVRFFSPLSFLLMLVSQTAVSHVDKAPQYYIDKLQEGPKALSIAFLNGLITTLQNADSDWISNFLYLDGLVALECAALAYDNSTSYVIFYASICFFENWIGRILQLSFANASW